MKSNRSTLQQTLAGALLALAAVSGPAAWAAQDLNVYGPGGPAPAMKEAAEAFGKQRGIEVKVTAGPTPAWAEQARQNADVLFSGAENMMSGFAAALPGVFDLRDARTLYLRPSAILVRPGNPKGIQGFKDLLKPGIKVMAVSGAGQTGLWEDVAGRLGDIETVRAFRANLVLPETGHPNPRFHAGCDGVWRKGGVRRPSGACWCPSIQSRTSSRSYSLRRPILKARGKSARLDVRSRTCLRFRPSMSAILSMSIRSRSVIGSPRPVAPAARAWRPRCGWPACR